MGEILNTIGELLSRFSRRPWFTLGTIALALVAFLFVAFADPFLAGLAEWTLRQMDPPSTKNASVAPTPQATSEPTDAVGPLTSAPTLLCDAASYLRSGTPYGDEQALRSFRHVVAEYPNTERVRLDQGLLRRAEEAVARGDTRRAARTYQAAFAEHMESCRRDGLVPN